MGVLHEIPAYPMNLDEPDVFRRDSPNNELHDQKRMALIALLHPQDHSPKLHEYKDLTKHRNLDHRIQHQIPRRGV